MVLESISERRKCWSSPLLVAKVAEFTILVLKIAFLVILWLFIVLIAAVVHSDMVGRKQKNAKDDGFVPAPPPVKRSKKEPWVLAIDSGAHAGERLQLVPQVHIGRSDGCELVLEDDYISSKHAMLENQGHGRWVIQDLGSTNGTYVNAEKIIDPVVVTPDDIIRIGGVQMRLEF